MSQYSPGHAQEQVHSSDTSQSVEDALRMEQDKNLIKSHPLFILLEMLFEKCEQATKGHEVLTSSGFDDELQEFVRQRQHQMNSIFTNDSEIDNLMIKAIQVLRIHLLELEKVDELCKDFCHRYITCLKGKMHSENLLRSDSGVFGDGQTLVQGQLINTPNANVTVNPQGEIILQGSNQSGAVSEGCSSDTVINGSTPLSQVGLATPPPQVLPSQIFHSSYNFDDPANKKSKRGVLPKLATETLRSWLFSHIVHPYPTEDEKRTLAAQTDLTLLQVNNWFINARRRILQPMLDAGNSNARWKKVKSPSSKAQERYWHESNSEEDLHLRRDEDGDLDQAEIISTITMETG